MMESDRNESLCLGLSVWIVISSVKRVFKTTVLAVMYSCPQRYCLIEDSMARVHENTLENVSFSQNAKYEFQWHHNGQDDMLPRQQSEASFYFSVNMSLVTVLIVTCQCFTVHFDSFCWHGWYQKYICLFFSSFFGFPFWMGSEKLNKK